MKRISSTDLAFASSYSQRDQAALDQASSGFAKEVSIYFETSSNRLHMSAGLLLAARDLVAVGQTLWPALPLECVALAYAPILARCEGDDVNRDLLAARKGAKDLLPVLLEVVGG